MVLKPLTPEERRIARDRALQARTARAEVKENFAEGKVSLQEIFDHADRDEAIGRMRTVDLLKSVKSVGPVRAESMMSQANIALNRRLRGLGRRQRLTLIDLLEEFKNRS